MNDRVLTNENLLYKIAICLVLATTILAVYWQVQGFDYVSFDDPRYVYENNTVKQGLSLDNIRWAFVTVSVSNWHPLTWISHMLDVQLFGVNPGMHHIINVIFHIISTLLLFLVLEKMTDSLWKSAMVSALFALHPLHVESVAWISERKDVLSTLFWMLTMTCYYWYVQRRGTGRYLLVVLSFIFGILTKPMLVTLPFVLLLIDYWPLKRMGNVQRERLSNDGKSNVGFDGRLTELGPLIIEKIPLIVIALISSGITFYAQQKGGAVVSQDTLSLGARISNAITSYIAYLGKMLWPMNLTIFYPYRADSIAFIHEIILIMILIFITVFALLAVKRFPYVMIGWLWYLGTLVPVIGIVQVGSQSMADRYTYIPLIGIFIIVVWGFSDILGRKIWGRTALALVSSTTLIFLCGTTWVQISFWKNSETLFSHALHVNRDNEMAHYNLGRVFFEKGDVDNAINHYKECLRVNPFITKAYINLGEAFAARKEVSSATYYYVKGLEVDPHNADIHTAFGLFLEGNGKMDEAIMHYNTALGIKPESVEARNNLGNALLRRGNYDDAIRNYLIALSMEPHQAEIYNNLGTAFIYKENIKEAIEYYRKAVQERPEYVEAKDNLANALINQSKYREILDKIQETMKADPENPALHTRLGDVYRRLGEYEESKKNYQNALIIHPKYVQAMYGISVVYSYHKDYSKALGVLQDIRELQPHNAEIYYNIACIYSRMNKIDEAVLFLKHSIDLGFHNWDLINKDPDLANIRNVEYVKKIVDNHNKGIASIPR